jgi:hypothetical protein
MSGNTSERNKSMKKFLPLALVVSLGFAAGHAEATNTYYNTWSGIGDTSHGVGPMVKDFLACWTATFALFGDMDCSYSGNNPYSAHCTFTACIYTCGQWYTDLSGSVSNGYFHSNGFSVLSTQEGSVSFPVPQSTGGGQLSGYTRIRYANYSFSTGAGYCEIDRRNSDGYTIGMMQTP